MNPEQLEKFIVDARRNKTSDEDIKKQLVVGGWKPEAIDAALSTTQSSQEKARQKMEEIIVAPHPVFLSTFLVVFVLLLIFFNFISYSGQILGIDGSPPVSNTELVGSIVFSFVGALVVSSLYALINKARQRS